MSEKYSDAEGQYHDQLRTHGPFTWVIFRSILVAMIQKTSFQHGTSVAKLVGNHAILVLNSKTSGRLVENSENPGSLMNSRVITSKPGGRTHLTIQAGASKFA